MLNPLQSVLPYSIDKALASDFSEKILHLDMDDAADIYTHPNFIYIAAKYLTCEKKNAHSATYSVPATGLFYYLLNN